MTASTDALVLCAFFACMLWQDGALDEEERHALLLLSDQLGIAGDDPRLLAWLELPPFADEVDPTQVSPKQRAAVLAVSTLAAGIRPTLSKFEALELLGELLAEPSAAQAVAA